PIYFEQSIYLPYSTNWESPTRCRLLETHLAAPLHYACWKCVRNACRQPSQSAALAGLIGVRSSASQSWLVGMEAEPISDGFSTCWLIAHRISISTRNPICAC